MARPAAGPSAMTIVTAQLSSTTGEGATGMRWAQNAAIRRGSHGCGKRRSALAGDSCPGAGSAPRCAPARPGCARSAAGPNGCGFYVGATRGGPRGRCARLFARCGFPSAPPCRAPRRVRATWRAPARRGRAAAAELYCTARGDEAPVEHEVDHLQHRTQALGQGGTLQHLERHFRVVESTLNRTMCCATVVSGTKKARAKLITD